MGVYIVTGANGGIGRAIVRALASRNCRVIMACRNPEKALKAREEIVQETGNTSLEIRSLDLSSLTSVKHFAEALVEEKADIQVLFNNAGIMCRDFGRTEDGIETMTQVNYLAPWLLTRLLLPLMGRSGVSRIVNTSSCTYRLGRIDEHFFQASADAYRLFRIYGRAKLAVLLFTLELADRLKNKPIVSHVSDPGVVNTGMITMHRWFDPLTDIFFRPFIKSPEKGALPALYLAFSPEAENRNGLFRKEKGDIHLPAWVKEPDLRKKLWKMTEERLEISGFKNILPEV